MPDFDEIAGRIASLRHTHRLPRHFGCLVAYAFQVRIDLDNGHHQAQVTGRRLSPRENGRALVVDAHLHPVDFVILIDDQLCVAAVHVDQRLDGIG